MIRPPSSSRGRPRRFVSRGHAQAAARLRAATGPGRRLEAGQGRPGRSRPYGVRVAASSGSRGRAPGEGERHGSGTGATRCWPATVAERLRKSSTSAPARSRRKRCSRQHSVGIRTQPRHRDGRGSGPPVRLLGGHRRRGDGRACGSRRRRRERMAEPARLRHHGPVVRRHQRAQLLRPPAGTSRPAVVLHHQQAHLRGVRRGRAPLARGLLHQDRPLGTGGVPAQGTGGWRPGGVAQRSDGIGSRRLGVDRIASRTGRWRPSRSARRRRRSGRRCARPRWSR